MLSSPEEKAIYSPFRTNPLGPTFRSETPESMSTKELLTVWGLEGGYPIPQTICSVRTVR